MASPDYPIICIGQASIDVGIALNRIHRKLEFLPLKMLYVNDGLDESQASYENHESNSGNPVSLGQYLNKRTSSNSQSSNGGMDNLTRIIQRCHFPRCCHHYIETSENCSICRDRIRVLSEHCKSFLDAFESFNSITIIAEIHTALCLWTYDQLMNIFEGYKIESKVQTILLKPPCKPCGIENPFAVYISALALQFSCAVFIRGPDEYLVEVDPDSTVSSRQSHSLDFADVSYLIACDLWPMFIPNNGAFYDEGQYILWPHHFVSDTCKVMDIRSSLYKTFSKMEKSNRKGNSELELKPVRLLSTNVHHLHLAYCAHYGRSNFQSNRSDINLASYTAMVLDTKVKQARFIHPSHVNEGDFTSLLGWATSGLPWTVLEESSFLPIYQSPKLSNQPPLSLSSAQIKIATVIFDSPYGKHDLFSYCEKTKDILLSGAYNHRFSHEESYISLNSISDAISIVESYFDPLSPFR